MTVIIIILLVIVISVAISYKDVRKLIKSEIIVKRIVNAIPNKNGDIKYENHHFVLKANNRIRTYSLTDLLLIKGYDEITHGLEHIYCVDFIFNKDKTILFDVSKDEQQLLVNSILVNELKVHKIDWDNFIGFVNDEGKDYQTLFQRQ